MPKYNVVGSCRPNGYTGERRDCTVRALSLAGAMSYEVAHEVMASVGRRVGKGESMRNGLIAANKRGLITSELLGRDHFGGQLFFDEYPNITNAVKLVPKGRYIFCTHKHAFAVVDGVILDSYKPARNCTVRDIYRVVPTRTYDQSTV